MVCVPDPSVPGAQTTISGPCASLFPLPFPPLFFSHLFSSSLFSSSHSPLLLFFFLLLPSPQSLSLSLLHSPAFHLMVKWLPTTPGFHPHSSRKRGLSSQRFLQKPWPTPQHTSGHLPIPKPITLAKGAGPAGWLSPLTCHPRHWGEFDSSQSTWTSDRGRMAPEDCGFAVTRKCKGEVEQANKKTCILQSILSSKFLGKCQDIGEIIYSKKVKMQCLILNLIFQRIK